MSDSEKHDDDCWRKHHQCAIDQVIRLKAIITRDREQIQEMLENLQSFDQAYQQLIQKTRRPTS